MSKIYDYKAVHIVGDHPLAIQLGNIIAIEYMGDHEMDKFEIPHWWAWTAMLKSALLDDGICPRCTNPRFYCTCVAGVI